MDALAELHDDLAHTAAPQLPDARCRGHHRLYDDAAHPGHPIARRVAIEVCHTCPCLAACRHWLDNLPPGERPNGVVAGQVIAATGQAVRQRRRRAA